MIKIVVKKLTKKLTDLVCPPATQDLELNTKNRNAAIEAEHVQYGPLNLSDEQYWEKAAEHWKTTTDVAKKSKCGNCVAFDISPRMKDCMPGSVTEDGQLGYCWMHHFKCHSARSCNTWAAGGPINEDEVSYDWQKRNLKQAIDPEPIDPDMYQDDTEGEEKNESLRNWFKKEKWVRIDTQGNITGACGTMKKGKAKTRCLPRKRAQGMSKAERKATVAKKVRGSKKGKQFVKNTKAAKVSLKKKK